MALIEAKTERNNARLRVNRPGFDAAVVRVRKDGQNAEEDRSPVAREVRAARA